MESVWLERFVERRPLQMRDRLQVVSCRDQGTGEPRVADNAAVAKSGNLLLVLKTDGELIVADGSNTSALTPIRTYKVAEAPTWGAPSFSGNRIFVKDATGVSMWTTA